MNLGGQENYPELRTTGIMSRNLTLTEQLEGKKADLEARLKEVTDALVAVKKNPELENMLNLIAKVRY